DATGQPVPPKYRLLGRGRWTRHSVREILRNPVYAGYIAHRRIRDRTDGKIRMLPREQWVMTAAEGAWKHPLSLAEYEEIQGLIQSRDLRKTRPGGRSVKAILTGILRCHEGA